jgi:hypothetical protein
MANRLLGREAGGEIGAGIHPPPELAVVLDGRCFHHNEAAHRPPGKFHRPDVLLRLGGLGVLALESNHQIFTEDRDGASKAKASEELSGGSRVDLFVENERGRPNALAEVADVSERFGIRCGL